MVNVYLFKLYLICRFVNISCPISENGSMLNLFQKLSKNLWTLVWRFQYNTHIKVSSIVVIHRYGYVNSFNMFTIERIIVFHVITLSSKCLENSFVWFWTLIGNLSKSTYFVSTIKKNLDRKQDISALWNVNIIINYWSFAKPWQEFFSPKYQVFQSRKNH